MWLKVLNVIKDIEKNIIQKIWNCGLKTSSPRVTVSSGGKEEVKFRRNVWREKLHRFVNHTRFIVCYWGHTFSVHSYFFHKQVCDFPLFPPYLESYHLIRCVRSSLPKIFKRLCSLPLCRHHNGFYWQPEKSMRCYVLKFQKGHEHDRKRETVGWSLIVSETERVDA